LIKKYKQTMEETQNKKDFLFKVLVIGDIGTGKTSIIKRYVHNLFSANYKSTIGVDFALKVLHLDENTTIRLQLWDIAGQERFGQMTRVYYKEAVGAFIVFEIGRVTTLEAIKKWKRDVDTKLSPNIPVILLANKCDLNNPKKDIDFAEEMDKLCEIEGLAGWFKTSAKTNTGIVESADFLVKKIIETKDEHNEPDIDIIDSNKIQETKQKKKSGGCC